MIIVIQSPYPICIGAEVLKRLLYLDMQVDREWQVDHTYSCRACLHYSGIHRQIYMQIPSQLKYKELFRAQYMVPNGVTGSGTAGTGLPMLSICKFELKGP